MFYLREKLISIEDLGDRMSADYLRREVDARILIKDLASKADLSRNATTL